MKELITEENFSIAYNWINNQINKKVFSDNGFTTINYADNETLNKWISDNLNTDHIKRMKGTIRQTLSKRKTGSIQITLNSEAHTILKDIAKCQGLTLSEVIIRELKDKWIDTPEQATTEPPEPLVIAIEDISLPTCKAEYNKLVSRLKLTDIWQKKNGQEQNMVRIFKASGVLLPNGKMSKPELTKYLESKGILTTKNYKTSQMNSEDNQ